MRLTAAAYNLSAQNRHSTTPESDADLFARFLDYRDDVAFEQLVHRHVPAVRAVCRSVLRDPNDADDATQATFLVLVRRAGYVRDRQALGAWLCRVAWRAANRLRQANFARDTRFGSAIDPDLIAARPLIVSHADELSVLDEEISRLPERYRLAILVCYRAGLSTAEAAIRLGWPRGTLLTRLAWAKKRLRQRLTKRGITLGASLSVAFACSHSHAAEVMLVGRIVAAGRAVAAAQTAAMEVVSKRVLSLTEGMVRTMIATKLKLAAGIGILIAALLGIGIGRMSLNTADAAGDDKKPNASVSPRSSTAVAKAEEPKTDPRVPAESVPAAAASDNELVVRRPLGSFTREFPLFGRATVTFTERQINVAASVRVDKAAFTVTLDGDYSINRESVVYGIITSADVGGFSGEEALELLPIVSGMNDIPFSFRVRVEDDGIVVKGFKCGPLGMPLILGELMGNKEKGMELDGVAGLICGKYKSDANPERNPVPPPAKPKRK